MTADNTDYELLIIGAGIHGCGIAQAAAAHGYRTCLIEQNTIASGTSSQSTKLIHGGLRYLEQGNLKLVYEALREREILLRLAPHLVEKHWFYIPVYKHSKRAAWQVHIGLWLYALLSKGRSAFKTIPQAAWHHTLPQFNTHDLTALFAYQDAATDDAALTHAVAASAQTFGCDIHEHTSMQDAQFKNQQWHVSLSTGKTITCRMLINAAGPCIDGIQQHIDPPQQRMPISLVQGTHLVLDRVCQTFIYTESSDGRVMFFRPWQGKTLVGTTETVFSGKPENAHPTEKEIADILSTYNHYFPESACTDADITQTYCGLRVLSMQTNKAAFSSNRETVCLWDNPKEPHYAAIYGGKLTTYRSTAEKLIRHLQKTMPAPHQADTRHIPL